MEHLGYAPLGILGSNPKKPFTKRGSHGQATAGTAQQSNIKEQSRRFEPLRRDGNFCPRKRWELRWESNHMRLSEDPKKKYTMD